MTRSFEHNGWQYEVDDYLPVHYFENQTEWAAPGIPLNPKMRADFDNTPNEQREILEGEHWWFRPFIVTYGWHEPQETVAQETRDEWRAEWFKKWPSGTRFDLRVLDGGAWDRSTFRGAYPTLEEAVEGAQILTGAIERALKRREAGQ